MTATTIECDALIIGAGPAGATTAAVLGEHGYDVRVLERERFPRYRVGESLIPYCWFSLDRLGLVSRLDACAFTVRKHSVQFVGLDGKVSTPFYFQQHTNHDCARTWQVVRTDFDRMMIENALEKGAKVELGVAAKELVRDARQAVIGARARRDDGTDIEVRARMTVDASGRDTFAQQRNGWRVPDARLRKVAIWTYYEGAKRDPGIDAGATTIAYLPDKGWFWYIPLPQDTVSVGVVGERDYLYRELDGGRDPDAIFAREVEVQPWIRAHLDGGRQVADCRVTGDYSYRSRHCAEDGLVLVGDAFAFLDPVFSSGVFLALDGGVAAGDAIDAALRDGDVGAARFDAYGRRVMDGIEAMRALVHAFYDTTFNFGDFIRAHPDLRGQLTDCLIGNVYDGLDPLLAALRDFADVPGRLEHGAPLVPGPRV